jgi:hypothetical protein
MKLLEKGDTQSQHARNLSIITGSLHEKYVHYGVDSNYSASDGIYELFYGWLVLTLENSTQEQLDGDDGKASFVVQVASLSNDFRRGWVQMNKGCQCSKKAGIRLHGKHSFANHVASVLGTYSIYNGCAKNFSD